MPCCAALRVTAAPNGANKFDGPDGSGFDIGGEFTRQDDTHYTCKIEDGTHAGRTRDRFPQRLLLLLLLLLARDGSWLLGSADAGARASTAGCEFIDFASGAAGTIEMTLTSDVPTPLPAGALRWAFGGSAGGAAYPIYAAEPARCPAHVSTWYYLDSGGSSVLGHFTLTCGADGSAGPRVEPRDAEEGEQVATAADERPLTVEAPHAPHIDASASAAPSPADLSPAQPAASGLAPGLITPGLVRRGEHQPPPSSSLYVAMSPRLAIGLCLLNLILTPLLVLVLYHGPHSALLAALPSVPRAH
jgi:hypothetical protein